MIDVNRYRWLFVKQYEEMVLRNWRLRFEELRVSNPNLEPADIKPRWRFRDDVLYPHWRMTVAKPTKRVPPLRLTWNPSRMTERQFREYVDRHIEAYKTCVLIIEDTKVKRTRTHGTENQFKVTHYQRYEWAIRRFCFGEPLKDIAAQSKPETVKRAIKTVLKELGLPARAPSRHVREQYPH